MDMAGAIQGAVWDQLANEGHPRPTTGDEVLSAAPYHYISITMLGFLKAVAVRLRDSSYYFNYENLDPGTCASETANGLCQDIALQTRPL